MSTDFRPTRIISLATTDNPIAGIRAIRNAAALTYKFARVSLSQVSRGADYEVDAGGGVSVKSDRQNANPARYTGDSTNGTDGTAAFAVATLSLKASYNANPGADTDDAPGVLVRTYASGYALASGEVYKVKVGGVLKTVTTDYTVSGQNIIFVYTKAPGQMGPGVEIFALSSATALTNETVTVTVDGVLQVLGGGADYTLADGIVTFVAGSVPLAETDIKIFFRVAGTAVWTFTGDGTDAGSSDAGVLIVYINDVEATLTTHYTVVDDTVVFVTAFIPLDLSVVRIAWTYAVEDQFAITGAVAVGDDAAPEVWIDGTKKTVTTHYTITNRIVTFEAAGMPLVDEVVKVIDVSAAAGVVPAGFVTFFDTQRLNVPAWDYIRAGGTTVVEVM